MIFYLLIERFWWPINLKRNSFRETCKVWPPCFIAFISILERACNYWKFTEFLMHNRTSFFSDSYSMMMHATGYIFMNIKIWCIFYSRLIVFWFLGKQSLRQCISVVFDVWDEETKIGAPFLKFNTLLPAQTTTMYSRGNRTLKKGEGDLPHNKLL